MAQSSNYSTVARPYAQAAFEVAQEADRLAEWGELLDALAALSQDSASAALIQHPAIVPADLADALVDALAGVDEAGANFIRLLAERRRLMVAGAIASQFAELRAEAEGRMTVEVYTARKLDEPSADKLRKALGERLGRKIELEVIDDETLLGGVVLRAGDLVIDGSVKGQLDRLAAAMSH
ncbi:F-type H+-transporting ATPase subunit delta [Natronospira proteinivora]|uniref:ATP synthase subunit delta n=1 Tax=Natronospira proteinivora TaxID=1807133 RepID=A0ABT1GA96_9GAMM|nr:F0F1 ATP synthase subunit delta [Natronospira proteinivora]MCP1728237.1 F-type H+-transporting ATPase subunit delta [Natronospira proteinivora]